MQKRSFILALALLLVPICGAQADDTKSEKIGNISGQWDLPGTRTSIEVRSDGTVQHWSLGAGVIERETSDFYKITYRQHNLVCRYEIKKYSDNELSVIVAIRPSPEDCDLGLLRRAPAKSGYSQQTEPNFSNKAQGDLPLAASGTPYKDCETCPELVVVPPGSFLMGSPETEAGRMTDEGPQRRVAIKQPFAVGRYAITVDEFDRFVSDTGYRTGDICGAGLEWETTSIGTYTAPPGFDSGFRQTGRHPVVCVSWNDAKAYVDWLSTKTKQKYRLLSEAEREYVTRAGTSTPYWWGGGITPAQALYDTRPKPTSQELKKAKASKNPNAVKELVSALPGQTAPVDAYKPNDWGLYQVHGNVADWTEDCWTKSPSISSDSSAPIETPNCLTHVLRGGSWSLWPEFLRASYRDYASADRRYNNVGFRVARDIAAIAPAIDDKN